ncbi:MAG TPA: CopD family protein [Pseudonocardia sp.]|nr:CopD family protein [Pseudonocardia sp.]
MPGAPATERLAPLGWAALAVVAGLGATLLAGSVSAAPVTTLVGASMTRTGMDVAGTACVGLALLTILLPGGRAARAVTGRADRLLVVVAGAWLVLTVLGIAFRAADAVGRPVAGLSGGELVAWSTRLAAGRGMVLAACCAVVVLGCAIARLRDPDLVAARIPLVAALLGVLTPAVTGHAGAAPNHQVAVVTAALHVGAAALWVGGLSALVALVARRRDLLTDALPRYSRLATACLAGVAVTGVLNAQVRLPGWDALLGSGYGLLVVAKAGALAGIAALGLVARRRLAAGRTPVLRWAGYEVALMAVALGLAAALTQTAP